MKPYHGIDNVFCRDRHTNKLIMGHYKNPEYQYLENASWIATEKIDGTNVRVIWDGTRIIFKGRTDNAQFPPALLTRLHELFDDKVAMFAEKFGDMPVCLYGEGYGPTIQKGGCYKNTHDFIVFDILINDTFLEFGNVKGIAEMLGIDVVPIIMQDSLFNIINFIKHKPRSTFGEFVMEGVIAAPELPLRTRNHSRIITKIKTRDFE